MMGRQALIGYTGFIGGNLAAQEHFDDLFNSSNIEQIANREYSLIACAAAPGTKWFANQQPELDRRSIERLVGALKQVQADHLVLISTVDVYPVPIGVDENTPIDNRQNDAYGRHRRILEEFVADHFASTIVRLPGLFGPGLRKNVVFDFLHGNRLDLINPESTFQFYDLSDLWLDIQRVRRAAIDLINFATEPVRVADVAREAFDFEFSNEMRQQAAKYDFRTVHSAALGGDGPYLRSREAILGAMREFIARERIRAAGDL
ncbi:MAG TPA: NAD-dependent epimerase/dehydratase family protein [Longimicrobiales bacterium]|nr:NAD-dependent epimerase/dehydratase family protein [Longimicrobiales bacterium]